MSPADHLRALFELFESQVGDIDETLSSRDTMWEGDEAHYRTVGESAVQCVKLALLAAGRAPSTIGKILDFPSGHGRVLRYLQRVFPEAAFTASDIDPDAVDFCAETFGATPVYSNAELTGLEFPSTYDLIWCGSLFTHLDSDRWTDLLRLFESLLSERGLVVFTVGGRTLPQQVKKGWDYGLPTDKLAQLIDGYRRDGFAFVEYDDHDNYGVSMARPSWTVATIERATALSFQLYLERGWDGHQDVVVCVKGMPELPAGPFPEKTAELDLEDF